MFIVINGGGKIGSYLGKTMLESGHEVSLIEKRREVIDRLTSELPGNALIIHGDGCDSQYQEDA
ncbi:MAG: NAD-binding protein, partial [Actinomycetota bacterium]|nr:NAD-binding protein [Actinomycetota bacterium]